MNPLNQQNRQVQMIKQIYELCYNTKNPMQLLEQLEKQNPQLKSVTALFKQGFNEEQVFIELCKRKGVNADNFLQGIKQVISK
jgi:hypothetical protein